MAKHHGTIRKYVAALLDVFNDLEIEYEDSAGTVKRRNIPIVYSSREKNKILDDKSKEQLLSGNTNVLPRSQLALSTLVKSEQRVRNKNIKINKIKTDDTYEYMYNSVPYEFTFELAILCRGMNDATMIVEQIAPRFNPTINIDVWDVQNLDEPTRVPIKLLDISIESDEYSETSNNLVTVNCGLSIQGNLYPPIKTIDEVKQFNIRIAQGEYGSSNLKTIMGWDVIDGDTDNPQIASADQYSADPPNVVSIYADNVQVGSNDLTLIYEYNTKDGDMSALTFEWAVLLGSSTIQGTSDTAVLTVTEPEDVQVQCTVTDIFGNYDSITKVFNVI